MITDNNSEHTKPEEFEDEEALKAQYEEMYDKFREVDAESAEGEIVYIEPSPEEKEKSMRIALECAEIADSMRAEDIKVYDVTGRSAVADFIVIASGYNKRQIQGITNEVEKAMKAKKVPISGVEGYDISWWILIDLNTVLMHVFYEDARKYYELDSILEDAPQIFSSDSENPENADDDTDETDETSTLED